MISSIFDEDSFKILSYFSISPGSKFKRKELKEVTKLNNVPLDNALAKILNSNILKKEKLMYSVNFENENARQIIDILRKQYYDLKGIPYEVYLMVTDFVEEISLKKDVTTYIFGDYSKLVYTDKSVIDIAYISEFNDEKDIQRIINKIESKTQKKIKVSFFQKEIFRENKDDPVIQDIKRNGTKIS